VLGDVDLPASDASVVGASSREARRLAVAVWRHEQHVRTNIRLRGAANADDDAAREARAWLRHDTNS